MLSYTYSTEAPKGSDMSSPMQGHHLASFTRLKDVAWDSDGETLVWLEGRGTDNIIVSQSSSDAHPRVLTEDATVRTRVGYGGGEFTVAGGTVYFVEGAERLSAVPTGGGKLRCVTETGGFASSPAVSPDGCWILFVYSEGGCDSLKLAAADGTSRLWQLATGADFYMQPVWHPKGRSLAWIEWDHPQMPWDGTRLLLGELGRGRDGEPLVKQTAHIAGGPNTAVFQPAFSPDGHYLSYVSDESGWGRIRLYDLGSATVSIPGDGGEGDIGQPAWTQGMRTHSWSADGGSIYFTRAHSGWRRACRLDLGTGGVEPLAGFAGFTDVNQVCASPRGTAVAAICSSATTPSKIISATRSHSHTWARSSAMEINPQGLSQPTDVSWSSADGSPVFGLIYPAVDGDDGPAPLIVDVHGGPTGHADCGFSPETQYFATRGYLVLAVNFRGSTGYGRSYMEALRGNWGIVDVEDAVSGARHLVESGMADPRRLVIAGGSSGGYTALRALIMHPGFFRAAVCRYGLTDLVALVRETHKFESRYFDSLLGPLPGSEVLYRARSPLFAADDLIDPVILFQGEDDDVVPRAQSDAIVRSLHQRGVPHEYHVFPGEGHGFRKPETVETYVRLVESFLARHLHPTSA